MNDFLDILKRINVDELLTVLSEESIKMGVEYSKTCPIWIKRRTLFQKENILLTAWDVLDIAYYAVCNGTEIKNNNKVSIGCIVNLYRGFFDEQTKMEYLKECSMEDVARTFLGMTAEQFRFQKMNLCFEQFNRNYHLLVTINKKTNRYYIDIPKAIESILDMTVEEYIFALLIVWWLASKTPLPMSGGSWEYIKSEKCDIEDKKVKKVIQYYCCTYNEVKTTSIGRQLFYAKPFIKNEKNDSVVTVSYQLVTMLMGSGLYWIARDYYLKKQSSHFINSFGLIFEDYIKELANKYCLANEWEIIPQGKKKGADYIFHFNSLSMLVESKSSLLKLNVKQQVPNLLSVKEFFEKTINEAYLQLNQSFEHFKDKVGNKIIKVILLFDEFSNLAIIEKSHEKIFQNDNSCFVMTIRHFEILLYLYANDKIGFAKLVNEIFSSIESCSPKRNMDEIYEKLKLEENKHLSEGMDYFQLMLDGLRTKLKK